MDRKPSLRVLRGGREDEQALLLQLTRHPEQFSLDEFGALMDRFRPRLSFAERMTLGILRMRRLHGHKLEGKMVVALLEGDDETFQRLSALQQAIRARGWRVISSEEKESNQDEHSEESPKPGK